MGLFILGIIIGINLFLFLLLVLKSTGDNPEKRHRASWQKAKRIH